MKKNPKWGNGYITMADWYHHEGYLEKAKEILLSAEQVEGLSDIDIVYGKLCGIYEIIGDENMVKVYDKKLKKIASKY